MAAAACTGETINLADAYNAPGFDFSGPRAFDERTGYRSQSFLTVPLKNHDAEVVGVLQLINARSADGRTIPFAAEILPLIEALASQAAVALDNQMLIDAQKNLFRAVLQGVRQRDRRQVALYRRALPPRARADQHAGPRGGRRPTEGPLADFHLTEEEWYELEVAGGLHDCGKVTTREFVVDKATKLETIYNRIHEIRTRFEVVKRDAEIEYLRAVMAGGDEPALRAARDARLAELDDDFAFVAECNIGGEFMAPEKIARVQRIAEITWQRTLDDRLGLSWEESARQPQRREAAAGDRAPAGRQAEPHHRARRACRWRLDNPWGFVLKPPAHKANLGEVYNLSIRRGTLTDEERYHINDHIVQTIIMLEALPFPKNLRRVPEWAGGHHEKMDGTGYPRGLKRDQMSIPARIMMIADIFEALTARDRPYKARKKLSECIDIMARMSRGAPHRPRPVRAVPELGRLPRIRRHLPAAGADRRGRHRSLSRHGRRGAVALSAAPFFAAFFRGAAVFLAGAFFLAAGAGRGGLIFRSRAALRPRIAALSPSEISALSTKRTALGSAMS